MQESERKIPRGGEERGLGHDAVVAAVSAATGGVVRPLVDQVTGMLHRPPKGQPPEIVLPPGVHKEE